MSGKIQTWQVSFIYHQKTKDGKPKKSYVHTFLKEGANAKDIERECRRMKTNPDEIKIELCPLSQKVRHTADNRG